MPHQRSRSEPGFIENWKSYSHPRYERRASLQNWFPCHRWLFFNESRLSQDHYRRGVWAYRQSFLDSFLSCLFVLSDGEIISAFDNTVTSRPTEDMTLISPTDHKEADTRLFLHVNGMGRKDFSRVMIQTVDIDVFLLSVSLYEKLGLEQHWADFGSGKHRCYLPIHQMILNPVKRDGSSLRSLDVINFCPSLVTYQRLLQEKCEIFSLMWDTDILRCNAFIGAFRSSTSPSGIELCRCQQL